MTDPFTPQPEQKAFVLVDAGGNTRRIQFETSIEAVHAPDGRAAFAITVDGQKFTQAPGGWRNDKDPTLVLLPATADTIEQVRSTARAARQRRHQLREDKKAHETKVADAERKVDTLRRQVAFHNENVRQSERNIERLRDDLRRAEIVLAQRVDARDRVNVGLEKQLRAARAELKALQASAP